VEEEMDQKTTVWPTVHQAATQPVSPRIAFVQSCWHRDVVDQGRDAFMSEMARHGIGPERIDLFEVPGAFEIPLHAKALAATARYSGIVACGFVVDGGIYRHDFVADAVIKGLMTVQLETGVPVFSAVLTPLRFHEHDEHRLFFRQHFIVKGTEVANACLRTVEAFTRLREQVQ
jgi:6,7-dimethyl-8-ribityllumazine synthase